MQSFAAGMSKIQTISPHLYLKSVPAKCPLVRPCTRSYCDICLSTWYAVFLNHRCSPARKNKHFVHFICTLCDQKYPGLLYVLQLTCCFSFMVSLILLCAGIWAELLEWLACCRGMRYIQINDIWLAERAGWRASASKSLSDDVGQDMKNSDKSTSPCVWQSVCVWFEVEQSYFLSLMMHTYTGRWKVGAFTQSASCCLLIWGIIEADIWGCTFLENLYLQTFTTFQKQVTFRHGRHLVMTSCGDNVTGILQKTCHKLCFSITSVFTLLKWYDSRTIQGQNRHLPPTSRSGWEALVSCYSVPGWKSYKCGESYKIIIIWTPY